MQRLNEISLSGFKSIRQLTELKLGRINILIGANGAGKSNFISFFKMLNWMTPAPGGLQFFISKSGGANSLLYQGAQITPQFEASLTFETDRGTNDYHMRLFYAAPDTLIFADEQFRFSPDNLPTEARWKSLGAGHREAQLIREATLGNVTARTILFLMKQCVVYQFHNTSDTARIRQKWDEDDNKFLKKMQLT